MKDQIVKLLVDRVGLDEGKANQAFDTVIGFLKENPDRIQGLLASEQGQQVLDKLDDVLPGGAAKKLSALFDKD